MALKKKGIDKKMFFYIALIALPLLQFAIFYVYVNFNSFFLSLHEFNPETYKYDIVWFDNFEEVFEELFMSDKSGQWAIRLKNSLFNFSMTLVVGMVGALIFSYYIYKKQFLSEAFKIFLFVPHIIPAIALFAIFKRFTDGGAVSFINNVLNLGHLGIESLLTDPRYNYPVILSFALFIGFGTQVMMYLGAMNKINPSITEAAQLDGITFFKEFWYITLPNVFPTIATFLVVSLTTFFTADMGVFGMFGAGKQVPENIQTIGFQLHKLIVEASNDPTRWGNLSAFGLCCTFIVAPLSYFLKQYLDKADPTM